MSLRIGVDIGGTFTDIVVLDELSGKISTTKALTTTHALVEGIFNGLQAIGVDLRRSTLVVHGTTVGVNAVIQRSGAKTALLTTEGFRDVLEIERGNSRRMFDLLYTRPEALVPRHLRREIRQRLSARGEVLVELDESTVRRAVNDLDDENVQSIAIVFLFSYLDATHERRTAEIVRRLMPGVSITMSHEISLEWREYERTSTTVVNAYVQPIMEAYLEKFGLALRRDGFSGDLMVMEANGGAFPVALALSKPVHTLESGPAAGAIGCAAISAYLQNKRLISFDMGGTTAKCCLIENGLATLTDEYFVDGRAIRIPVIDVKEVSAGGGSIAWIDTGGALVLGPQSAGSDPGPACYGLGGKCPTVTDANVLAGRINSSAFLGGRMPLDTLSARKAIETVIGRPLGVSVSEAAAGILRLAEVKMALAVRSITTERGLDPRDYALVAYGGSGPLHAAAIARELAIPTLVIPPSPSTFSAWGMLVTDLRHDIVRTALRTLGSTDAAWAEARFIEMQSAISDCFPLDDSAVFRRAVDLRYAGHTHLVTIAVQTVESWSELRRTFDDTNARVFGYAVEDIDVEIVNLRLSVIKPVAKYELPTIAAGTAPPRPQGWRDVFSSRSSNMLRTAVHLRSELQAGAEIVGPAVVEEADTTTVIDVGDTLRVEARGLMIVEVGC